MSSIQLGSSAITTAKLGSTQVSSIYLGTNLVWSNGPTYDTDAQKFINATGISGSNATAINQLVLDLKSYSLWTKMVAAYPIIGTTSSTTSYNLKDTGSFQITWNGSVAYDGNGVTGDGSTGYGNTNLNPTSVGVFGSGAHLSAYVRTYGNDAAYHMGGSQYPGISPSAEWMLARFGGDRYAAFGNVVPGNPYIISTGTPYIGLFCGTVSSGTTTLYLNGSSLASGGGDGYSVANQNMGLLGQIHNGGTPSDLSTRQYAWYSIGLALSSTDASNLYTAVQAYETTLGRQV